MGMGVEKGEFGGIAPWLLEDRRPWLLLSHLHTQWKASRIYEVTNTILYRPLLGMITIRRILLSELCTTIWILLYVCYVIALLSGIYVL